jgi:Brp/Blh family beta-carotene 15,15'-monooxygenase
MICAGIPHGSFDLRVAEAKWRNSSVSRKKIVVSYLVGVLGMTGLCVFFPLLGLSLFLVLSVIHFSEGESSSAQFQPFFVGPAFGIGAILIPIGLHVDSAQAYMSYFVPYEIFTVIALPLRVVSYVAVVLLAVVLFFLRRRQRQEHERAEALQRLVCLGAWIMLPPLSGFAVWFIGRHSRQHLEACHALFSRSGFRIPVDFALISALAILGLLPFSLFFDFSRIEDLFAASLCLIAGLTLPHMVVSHRMKEIEAYS